MKLISVLIILGLLLAIPFGGSWAVSGPDKDAIMAAHGWLAGIDKGRYGESWKEASAYFRGAVSRSSWEASLNGIRKPLGKLVFRRAISSQRVRELPGAPDGVYVIIRFRASFEYKKSAIETVTFIQEKDGTWRAAGYYIK